MLGAEPELTDPIFNLEESKDGIECSDLTKLINFDSFKEFGQSALNLEKEAANLGTFSVCGTYRHTVKISSKMPLLHITNFNGKFQEKKVHSSPQILQDYYLHARINQSFTFKDFLKVKMIPAHWLKINPIKLGEKKEFL